MIFGFATGVALGLGFVAAVEFLRWVFRPREEWPSPPDARVGRLHAQDSTAPAIPVYISADFGDDSLSKRREKAAQTVAAILDKDKDNK